MPRFPLDRYAVSIALVGVVFVLRAPIEAWAGDGNSPILYLPAVTLAAWMGGLGPGLLAAAIGGVSWVYLDIPPVGSFHVPSAGDRFRVAVFALEAILLSSLMERLHSARRASERDARAAGRYREELATDEARLPRDPRQLLHPDLDQGPGRALSPGQPVVREALRPTGRRRPRPDR